jgi:hypothetical protein
MMTGTKNINETNGNYIFLFFNQVKLYPMKTLALAIVPLVLLSCTNRSNNSASNGIPKGYQQVTYLIDTIADKYEFKEILNISDVIFNNAGEVKSAVQTNFSFKNQEGEKSKSTSIYSPIQNWSFSGDSIPILQKYSILVHTDTLIKDDIYSFRYDKDSRLISFTQAYQPESPIASFDFFYDLNGQWTQVTKRFRDERSGHSYYEITKREFRYTNKTIKSINPIYLTVNGVNIFTVPRGIVEYYVLLGKAGLFSSEGNNGVFDEPNSFFENEDEGTGAGVFTSQLCGWKTNDGKDIIGINGFFRDPGSSFPITNGNPPKFYLFENKSFTELTNIFPEVKPNLFFDSDTGSAEGIITYFTLPRIGETIQYNLGIPIDFLRKTYNDYKEMCDKYSNIKRTSINIAFENITGTFRVSN